MINISESLSALKNMVSHMKFTEIAVIAGGVSGGMIALFVPGGVITGVTVWLSSAIIPAAYIRVTALVGFPR